MINANRYFTRDDHLDSPGFSAVATLDDFKNYMSVRSFTKPHETYHYYDGEESNLSQWYSDKGNQQEGDFGYDFNELGFRSGPPVIASDICYYGCSATVGLGVSARSTWTALVDAGLGLTSNNFGIAGASIDEIAQTFAMSTRLFSIKRAVFLLPDMTRHTLPIAIDDQLLRYSRLYSNYEHDSYITQRYKQNYLQLIESYYALPDEFFADRFKQTLSFICFVAKLCGVKLYLSTWSSDPAMLRLLRATGEQIISGIDNDQRGRDAMHPGLVAHRDFADRVISVLSTVG